MFVSGDVQIPNIVSKNYAINLDSLAQQSRCNLSQFYPQIIQGLTFNGNLAGLTDNWDTQVMYYNKTLFQKAGVALPNANWTWDDFQNAARAANDRVGFVEAVRRGVRHGVLCSRVLHYLVIRRQHRESRWKDMRD